MGIKNRTWTQEMDEQVVRLLKLGHSFGAIAVTMCLSRNAVLGRVHRMKLAGVEVPRVVRARSAVERKPARRAAVRLVAEPRAADPPRRAKARKPKPTYHDLPLEPAHEAERPSRPPVQFIDLADDMCHYGVQGGFCGETVFTGKRFCARHCRIVYTRAAA